MRRFVLAFMVMAAMTAESCNSWGKVAPKGVVRNEVVEADIRKNLLGDGITGLEVNVYDNGTAMLKGHVKTRADRQKAIDDAMKVSGVKHVDDQISVE